MTTDLNRLCRACLAAKESFTYFLFDNVPPENYYFCTSVEINEEEQYPRAICDDCYLLLTKLSDFKRKCIESQNKLTTYNTLKLDLPSVDVKKSSDNLNNELHSELIFNFKEETENHDDYLEAVDNSICDTLFCEEKFIKKGLKKANPKAKVKLKAKKHFSYECGICKTKFSFQQRFEAHMQEHEGKVIPIQCAQCDKTFKNWSSVKRHHDAEHTAVSLRRLRCAACGKIFKSAQTLQLHRKAHGQRSACVCHVCGRGFTTGTSLKTHMETHQENRERNHTCDHCGKKFFSSSLLRSHTSKRHRGRRFICQICSYPFTDKYNLVQHLLKHDGKKIHQCDICNKSYASQSTLVEHKRIHSGERPYICSYCPKSFVSRRMLNEHHRIHTGEKPYKCGVCEQTFTQRGTLKRHMKVHDRAPAMN